MHRPHRKKNWVNWVNIIKECSNCKISDNRDSSETHPHQYEFYWYLPSASRSFAYRLCWHCRLEWVNEVCGHDLCIADISSGLESSLHRIQLNWSRTDTHTCTTIHTNSRKIHKRRRHGWKKNDDSEQLAIEHWTHFSKHASRRRRSEHEFSQTRRYSCARVRVRVYLCWDRCYGQYTFILVSIYSHLCRFWWVSETNAVDLYTFHWKKNRRNPQPNQLEFCFNMTVPRYYL